MSSANVNISTFSLSGMSGMLQISGINGTNGPLGSPVTLKSIISVSWHRCQGCLEYGEGWDFIVQWSIVFTVGLATRRDISCLVLFAMMCEMSI